MYPSLCDGVCNTPSCGQAGSEPIRMVLENLQQIRLEAYVCYSVSISSVLLIAWRSSRTTTALFFSRLTSTEIFLVKAASMVAIASGEIRKRRFVFCCIIFSFLGRFIGDRFAWRRRYQRRGGSGFLRNAATFSLGDTETYTAHSSMREFHCLHTELMAFFSACVIHSRLPSSIIAQIMLSWASFRSGIAANMKSRLC